MTVWNTFSDCCESFMQDWGLGKLGKVEHVLYNLKHISVLDNPITMLLQKSNTPDWVLY